MPLIIDQQRAQLGWQTQNAKLAMSNNHIQALDLEIQKPTLEMQSKAPRILIDQTQPFAEAGLKNIQAFMEESVSHAKQVLLEGIGRIVDDGNAWIDIHNDYDPIPDQAVYNAYEMFDKSFNYGAIPTSRPRIDVDEGSVTYHFTPGRVTNRGPMQKVDMQYTPGKVDYFMKQYASIQFRFEKSSYSFTV